MNNQKDYFSTNGFSAKDYSNQHIEDAGGKGLSFIGCNFSYCFLERCYFHNAKFERCSFIGTRISYCNFRSATFSNCDFAYATFETTIISENEIIQNLPYEPNKRRDLIRSLRMNSSAMGNQAATNGLLSLELKASAQHHYNVYRSSSSYYNKYSFRDKISSFFSYVGLQLEDKIWGYGISPLRLFKWILLIITISGTIIGIGESGDIIVKSNLPKNIFDGVSNSVLAILDLGLVNSTIIERHRTVFGILVAARTTI